MSLPHDVTDLHLAPVALALDEELEMLGVLAGTELVTHLLIAANRAEADLVDRGQREEILVRVLTRSIDLHGWEVGCDPRGLRLSHRDHSLVLGLSPGLRAFLDGSRD